MTTSNLLDGFTVGDFQVFPREEKIVGGDSSHHVEPKVMQVLVTLASNAGHTVSRDQILEEVWSDAVVGDEVLSRAISLLRGYFGDERTSPRYIRTVPRKGYELIAEVGARPAKSTGAISRGRAYALVALVAALVVATAAVVRWWPATVDADLTLAVMPLAISGEASRLGYVADGLADHLITHLTRSPELHVVARRSSFLIRDTDANVRAIGEQLGARYIVEGSLAERGANLLVTMYVVDTELGTNIWTTQLLGPANDLASLQVQAERAINEALRARLGVKLRTSRSAAGAISEDAYLKYHEARYQWSLRGELRIARAIALLQEAIDLAPDFAEAHMALAQTLAVQPFYTDDPVAERFVKARASAARALELDASLAAEASALEGFLLWRERRWQQAEIQLKKALRLDPDQVNAHYWYSWLLSALGKYDEAMREMQIAWRLNPVSAVLNDRLAVAYLWVNDNAEAAARYQAAADLGYLESTQPESYILFLRRAGRFSEIAELLVRMGYSAAWVEPFVRGLEHPDTRQEGAVAIEAASAAGDVPFELLFGIWVLFEDGDRAFANFDYGLKTKYIEFLWADETEFLRDDARFADLIARLNLSDVIDLDEIRSANQDRAK
jgi:TolB-like protein/DNA-binding winged helix-turn-helix (wHTH) protein